MALDKNELIKLLDALDLPDSDFEAEPERGERLREIFEQLPENVVGEVMKRLKEVRGASADPVAFARAHEISAAEMLLMESLIVGKTVIEHAERLGISVNTARTHMRRLLEKTGSRNQIDLISTYYGSNHT